MNDDEFAEKPSGFMLGKEFVIVVVIIFSGLSFTLGYFVGKSGTPKPELAMQAVESPGQFHKQALPPAPPSPASAPAPELTLAASPIQQAVLPQIKEPGSQIVPVTEKPAPEKSALQVEPALALETKNTLYTVQIGAFMNIAEAKQLKANFNKKGYKSYISSGKNRKAQKIYKVKTGEFKEKNEAEVLALKLRKTEGLQTYVTMKTE